VDEVALIRDTISHYAPVLIAPLSIQIRRAGVKKKFGPAKEIRVGLRIGRRNAREGEMEDLLANLQRCNRAISDERQYEE
jgi:hypothetical protein